MEEIKNLLGKYKNFIIYSLIGVTGATLDFLTYWLLTEHFSFNKVLSNTLTTSLGIINNFILNMLFNFKVKDKILKRFISFYSVGILGLLLSNLIIFIFVDKLQFNNLIVKLATIIIIVLVQYNLNKKTSFKK